MQFPHILPNRTHELIMVFVMVFHGHGFMRFHAVPCVACGSMSGSARSLRFHTVPGGFIYGSVVFRLSTAPASNKQVNCNNPGAELDVRLTPLGPTTVSLVVTSAFLQVEFGPDLLQEVQGTSGGHLQLIYSRFFAGYDNKPSEPTTNKFVPQLQQQTSLLFKTFGLNVRGCSVYKQKSALNKKRINAEEVLST